MTDYDVGILKATDNKRCVWAEDPYDALPEDEEPSSLTSNFRCFEGVLKIDGEPRKWKAYSVERWSGSSDGEYKVDYGYNIRVDLMQWRKRKDAKAIRTAIHDAITAEAHRLDAENGCNDELRSFHLQRASQLTVNVMIR